MGLLRNGLSLSLLMVLIFECCWGRLTLPRQGLARFGIRKRLGSDNLWVRRGGYAPGEWRSGSYYEGDEEFDQEDGYGQYEPRPKARRPAPRAARRPSVSFMDQQLPPQFRRAGLMLLGASAVLTMVGISLFFERTLLRLANLCLVIGLPLQFGPGRIVRLLFDKNKLRATGCFLFGLFLVMRGNSFLGILIEIFGFCNLFMNLFPFAMAMLGNLPVIGDLLKRPSPAPRREPPPRRYDYDDEYYYPRR